jgi:DNA-binding beta-propeller fold protein YncE
MTGPGDPSSNPVGPQRQDPYETGVSRRQMLRGSTAAGVTAATAGCLGDSGTGSEADEPTVYVFNTGDRTLSVIDAVADEVVTTTHIGTTASFPANQYAPRLTDVPDDHLWLNVSNGVRALTAGSLESVTSVETGSGANWLALTPSGSSLVVSAREPAHAQYRIDVDRRSETFDEVTATIDRTEGYDGRRNGPGPCDVTFHPEGTYAFVPDLYGDTLTVLDVEAFEVATQVAVEPVVDGVEAARPWMGTASWDGQYLAVEHSEGTNGTESIWDVSDPTTPEELARLTAADGLGAMPLTSEIGPDNRTLFVFTPNSQDVTVIDLDTQSVVKRIDLGGNAYVGTWNPERTKLYVPIQTRDEVAVIDADERRIATRLEVGAKPYGATAGSVRPRSDMTDTTLASLASLGFTVGKQEMTYCRGECYCSTDSGP